MLSKNLLRRSAAAAAVLAIVAGPAGAQQTRSGSPAVQTRVGEPVGVQRPSREVLLSVGEGELITLPANVANVWVSNPAVADVYVNNPRQIHLFGKEFGEATVFATTAGGAVIYSTRIRVSQNITSIDRMFKVAMPEADIKVNMAGQLAVLTGTVASPDDVEQAQRLALTMLNPGVDLSNPAAQLKMVVFNRLRTATPLQVQLQVRFAEVSRSFVKNIGVNFATRDSTGGFMFGLAQGRQPGLSTAADLAKFPTATVPLPGGGVIEGAYDPATGSFINPRSTTVNDVAKGAEQSTFALGGKLLGLDILSAIDLGETIGQVTTLASPNLTALSGESSTFLAGGEIPIPVSQALGAVSIEYKQYGVSLAFTPTVLSDGRISMRVRPEVSQLTSAGAVTLNSLTVPAFSTRRAETTVELGSGESFMIAGLLSNDHNNNIEKTPGLGDMPILGSLFRSNGFRRNETELVIVITPYLVKPVNANQIVLPTDGYRAPDDFQRVFNGQLSAGTSGAQRPKPTMAPPAAAPAVGAAAPAPLVPAAPGPRQGSDPAKAFPAPSRSKKGGAAPGFGF